MNALMEMKEKAHARQVLGISHNASKKEISKAYKDLARKYRPTNPHPIKNVPRRSSRRLSMLTT